MTVPGPALRDSRRLTGPNLLTDQAGAVIEVEVGGHRAEAVVDAWRHQLGRILPALGWGDADVVSRVHPGGVSLAFTAPIDALYAATEVNEWAFEAAAANLVGSATRPRLDEAVERLSDLVADEQNPRVLAVQRAARERDVAFTWDDDHVSVGMGVGSITWAVDRIPDPSSIDWDSVHDVPVALVTGSNGKTTTVRILAAIVRAWGKVPGYSCTDGIVIDGNEVDAGDWSGPGGARAVLRHRSVEVAILETARGGLLRRGLALDRADAACVTNVAADHLGEWGVYDVADIARAKLVVSRAVTGRPLIVNADDEVLAAETRALVERATAAGEPTPRVQWMGRNAAPGHEWFVEDGVLVHRSESGDVRRIVSVDDMPVAMGGSASYNVMNALTAAALARAMGISDDAVAMGLTTFASRPEDNPGRGALYRFGGITVLVDFAHNPHGVRALGEWVLQQDVQGRVITMVGQAGDRDDEAIADLARATREMDPDLVVVKSMVEYARGRDPAEIAALLRAGLEGAGDGPTPELISADSEVEAVRVSLQQARVGDLVVLPVQADRAGSLSILRRLQESGWNAGDPVPPPE